MSLIEKLAILQHAEPAAYQAVDVLVTYCLRESFKGIGPDPKRARSGAVD